MSMEQLTGMWEALKQTAAGQSESKGEILSGCEAELQELMKQIDIMVHSKRMEWEREQQSLHARLDIRNQEWQLQKDAVTQKQQEISELRQQITGLERSQRELITEYERQLAKFREEVAHMKREYAKLQKRYNKHAKDSERDKSKATNQKQHTEAEVTTLKKQIEEHKQSVVDWEQERWTYQRQIDALQSQNKSLAEKCELVQQQATGFQNQLGRRREMLDSTELNLKSQIAQLQGQLERSRDTVNSQETQLSRLKAALDESIEAQRSTLAAKEKVEGELRQGHNNIRKLEEESTLLRQELESRIDLLRYSENTQRHLEKDVSRLEQSMTEKDTVIQTLEDISQKEQLEQIRQLQEALRTAKSELRHYKKTDKRLSEDLAQHRDKLDSSRMECADLNEEIAGKIEEIRLLEAKQKHHTTEVAKLKDKLTQEQSQHSSQAEGMRQELSQLTSELHHRNLSMATLSEKVALMEKQLRQEADTMARKSAEIQVLTAQLEALRLENRHLRKSTLRLSSSVTEADDIESQLQELRDTYTTSLARLEEDNQRLQEQVKALRTELHRLEDTTRGRLQSSLEDTHRTIHQLRVEEDRRVRQLEESSEHKEADLQQQLHTVVQKYEAQVHTLQKEKDNLQQQLHQQTQALKRVGLENVVMTQFVDGVEQIVHTPPHRGTNSSYTASQYSPLDLDLDISLELGQDEFILPGESPTTQFLAEEKQRTEQLQQKLDFHIEGLKQHTDNTIQKFVR